MTWNKVFHPMEQTGRCRLRGSKALALWVEGAGFVGRRYLALGIKKKQVFFCSSLVFRTFAVDMKKITYIIVILAALSLTFSCGNRKSAADYEGMLDSIRKAEVEKELLKPSGGDPVIAFFDSLAMKSVPMKYSPEFVEYLPQMQKVPAAYNSRFDYESNVDLYAVKLPSYQNYHLMLLGEKLDSTNVSLYLCTMNRDYVLVDRLCIYEQKIEDRNGRQGLMRQEYYVTSQYEVTLLSYFRGEDDDTESEEAACRYVINKEGNFEEVIIEL